MKITISIINECGKIKAFNEGEDSVNLVYDQGYDNGDVIKVTTTDKNCFYQIKIDETIENTNVYLTDNEWIYTIDFHKRNKSLHKNAFDESVHYLYVKKTESVSLLSNNPLDQEVNMGMYPHVSANAQTRGEPAFACVNIIDGLAANTHHGKWPYTSWGIGGCEDACVTLEFGRVVVIEKVIVYLRAQFPHDSWWTEGVIKFGDECQCVLNFKKTKEGQVFQFDNIKTDKISLGEFIKANDESQFPSLSLIEVYGHELNKPVF